MELVKLVRKIKDFLFPFEKEERENKESFKREMIFLNNVIREELKKTINKIENEK